MGYDLHITRADDPITESEWHAVVADDDSLTVSTTDYYARQDSNGGVVRIPAVLWSGDSEAAFWFDRGEVTAKNPNDGTIVKMLQLASRLSARLVGDDDEEIRAADRQ